MEEQQRGKVITVFSTASAVGKTLLSINMAAEFAGMGYKVCLVDLDLQFGDVGNYLKLQGKSTIFDLMEADKRNASVFDMGSIFTHYVQGNIDFMVLPAPSKLEQSYNISAEEISRCISRFIPKFDYIVIDTTSAFSELNLAVMDFSTIITFVGIVDFIPTIKNMKIGYDTMCSIGCDNKKIRLVLNRSNSKTNIELNDVEQLLGEKFYHVIPNDFAEAQQSVYAGIPLLATGKNTLLRQSIQQLAAKYTDTQLNDAAEQKGVSGWVKRIFK
ncbi:AAA family ATPase [Pectinatus sottacetonis]|uniref:AAA family ATPase n=1 Tax=Pectinatus sottacetonis TaxID=1002795 RepID=UPI0018C6E01A|nr:AAA family ATPase [Pectinatus sottacetonis]